MSTAKSMTISNPERMRKGRAAVMVPVSTLDHYCVDGRWDNAVTRWVSGQVVQEIHHYGMYHTTVGDILDIFSDTTHELVCKVQVTEIMMTAPELLNDEDLFDLGFFSHQAMRADKAASSKHGIWLISVASNTPA